MSEKSHNKLAFRANKGQSTQLAGVVATLIGSLTMSPMSTLFHSAISHSGSVYTNLVAPNVPMVRQHISQAYGSDLASYKSADLSMPDGSPGSSMPDGSPGSSMPDGSPGSRMAYQNHAIDNITEQHVGRSWYTGGPPWTHAVYTVCDIKQAPMESTDKVVFGGGGPGGGPGDGSEKRIKANAQERAYKRAKQERAYKNAKFEKRMKASVKESKKKQLRGAKKPTKAKKRAVKKNAVPKNVITDSQQNANSATTDIGGAVAATTGIGGAVAATTDIGGAAAATTDIGGAAAATTDIGGAAAATLKASANSGALSGKLLYYVFDYDYNGNWLFTPLYYGLYYGYCALYYGLYYGYCALYYGLYYGCCALYGLYFLVNALGYVAGPLMIGVSCTIVWKAKGTICFAYEFLSNAVCKTQKQPVDPSIPEVPTAAPQSEPPESAPKLKVPTAPSIPEVPTAAPQSEPPKSAPKLKVPTAPSISEPPKSAPQSEPPTAPSISEPPKSAPQPEPPKSDNKNAFRARGSQTSDVLTDDHKNVIDILQTNLDGSNTNVTHLEVYWLGMIKHVDHLVPGSLKEKIWGMEGLGLWPFEE